MRWHSGRALSMAAAAVSPEEDYAKRANSCAGRLHCHLSLELALMRLDGMVCTHDDEHIAQVAIPNNNIVLNKPTDAFFL